MKKFLLLITLLPGSLMLKAQSGKEPFLLCDTGVRINREFSRAAVLDSILNYYTTGMLPGASLAVYTEKEGWWVGTAGYASLENRIPMDACHLQYMQSVSKTFIAVEILQLQEEGRIGLDDPITKYLPEKYSRYVPDAGAITVRMLLNHRSGIPEYNEDPGFVSTVMLHPLKEFSSEDCLKTLVGKALLFTPGSRYKYINTNYLLLALIGDAITGDHAAYIVEHIFKPLAMKNSFYANDHDYLKGLYLPESYWDVLNVGIPANFTPFQQLTVVCSKGDDGIICAATDAVVFLKGLMEGKLLNPESMKKMFEFVTDAEDKKRYGMGIAYFDLGGLPAYGHGGGGIGAGCGLVYIPSHQVYLFISTNLGVFVDSNLSAKAAEMRDAVLLALLQ